MRKFTKVLSVILCLALLSDFAVFPVFAEELPQDEYSVEEDAVLTGAEAEDVAEAVDEAVDVLLPEEDCFEEFTEANADDAELPEEAQTDETDPEEMPEMQEDDAFDPELLGDGENITYRPYPDASYELKYHILEDKTISIDGYIGTQEGRLILPNTIKRRKVTMIGDNAFLNCSGFTGDLIIPDNVTEIGINAFSNCYGFDGTLTIGKNVELIDGCAFVDCSGFRGDLIIPDSVTEIWGEAFHNCSGFDGTLTIGNSVEKIAGRAFMNCNGFRGDLIIPDSVKEIQGAAFRNCSGFDGTLTIGNSVEKIASSTFQNCSGFTGDLIIPDSVTEIENSAFEDCSGFHGSLTIGNGVEHIKSTYPFENCGFTGNLIIGDGVKEIDSGAFYRCTGFTGHLIIGRNLEGIEVWNNPFSVHFRMVTNRSETPFEVGIIIGGRWSDFETGEDVGSVIANHTVYRNDAFSALDADEFTHAWVADRVYTGFPVKPVIEVYHRKNRLQEKKDYTIKYTDNTNVGTATFTITGKGNFTSTASDTFRILAKDIAEEDVIVAEIPAVKENGRPYNPVPTVTYNGKKLAKGKDFKILYYSNETYAKNKNLNTVNPTGAGIYYARIDGMNNFKSYVVKPFMIAADDAIPVNILTVAKIKDKPYTGGNITLDAASLIVKNKKDELTFGEDYKVAYYTDAACRSAVTPKEVGTYYVKITGEEDHGYVGSKIVSFKIVGTPISKYTVDGFMPSLTYNGAEREQSVTLKDKDGHPLDSGSYTVSYTEDTTNVGTVTMFVTGAKGITGTIKKTYKITPFDAAKDKDGALTLAPITDPVPFAKSGAKPKVTVKFNGTPLTEGIDYTLSYTNNKAIADASDSKAPTVKVTCKGNFKGTNDNLKTTFSIVAADMSATGVHVVAKDVVYTDKDFGWMQKKFSVVDQEGKALKAGTDYDAKNVEYRLSDKDGRDLKDDELLDAGTVVCVVVHAKPGSNYTGIATGTYRIAKQDISKLNVNAISKTYTGKDVTIKPSDIIWKAKGKIIHDVEIEIDESSYKNNVKKGKATVTVRGTGPNYCGTKTITFGIGVRKILWWWL